MTTMYIYVTNPLAFINRDFATSLHLTSRGDVAVREWFLIKEIEVEFSDVEFDIDTIRKQAVADVDQQIETLRSTFETTLQGLNDQKQSLMALNAPSTPIDDL